MLEKMSSEQLRTTCLSVIIAMKVLIDQESSLGDKGDRPAVSMTRVDYCSLTLHNVWPAVN